MCVEQPHVGNHAAYISCGKHNLYPVSCINIRFRNECRKPRDKGNVKRHACVTGRRTNCSVQNQITIQGNLGSDLYKRQGPIRSNGLDKTRIQDTPWLQNVLT